MRRNQASPKQVVREVYAFAAAMGKSWALGQGRDGKTFSAREFALQVKGVRARIQQLRQRVETAIPETTPEDFSLKLCLLTALTKASKLLAQKNTEAARQLFADFPNYVEKLQGQHELLQRPTN